MKIFLHLTAVAGLAIALALPASVAGALGATLLDGTVSIVNYYPSLTTPYDDVQGSGPTTSVITLNDSGYHFSFTADTLTFTNPYCCTWGDVPPGGWGGFVLTFSGIPTISNVVNDASSTLTLTSLAFNSDTIWMEYVSSARYDGAFTTLDISFSTVPEPSTWAMMLIGFAGLGFAGYLKVKGNQVFLAA